MSARRELVALLVLALVALALTSVAGIAGAIALVPIVLVAGGVAHWHGHRAAQPPTSTVRDDLTGLPLRASLASEVAGFIAGRSNPDEQLTLHLFDLVGFKKYNDAYGFAAGDALLRHLSQRLIASVGHRCDVYRLRGAQFALLSTEPVGERHQLRAQTATHLREAGEGFLIECAAATVVIPRQAHDLSEALKLADHELQAERGTLKRKGVDEGAITSSTANRLQSSPYEVADLASAVSQFLGLDHDEIEVVHASITWRDVGMMALPESILLSDGPLSDDAWRFVKLHTLVGERLLRSNFGLHRVAGVVRSSHERWDGGGYPDGLAGHDIPIVARIVFVCSAFEDMTSPRPHRRALSATQALEELRRNAGGQFDPHVVAAFSNAFAERPATPATRVS
ncbi:MAG TPA: HD domain-containing phosphohydrolase [Solirubrobacteraceae bacterium]|nr:HD domain-containing phosphohydrolase [Solirubrobacteraceae bacterium]